MKQLFLLLVGLLIAQSGFSQIKAVTENGDEVFLYNDGSWRYANEDAVVETDIPINNTRFERDPSASFLLKSNKINAGFWINPKVWDFGKPTDGGDGEFEVEMKNGDLYGMIITEEIQIPLETLKGIAVENGRSAAPDIRVVHEEIRNVNGLDVLLLEMEGTIQGIEFTYFGYYFSNESGTLQYITYSSQGLMKRYRKECELLLNGLVELR